MDEISIHHKVEIGGGSIFLDGGGCNLRVEALVEAEDVTVVGV